MQNKNETISRHCGHGPRVQGFYKGKTALLNRLDPGYPAGRPSGMTTRSAFTLIELLVVVLIIGILAAVAVPQYQKTVLRSRYIQAVVNVQALEKAQKIYHLANGAFARDVAELGMSETEVSCYPDGDGVYCSAGAGSAKGMWIEWHARDGSGKAKWVCWTNNSVGKSVCQMYQKEWGGSFIREAEKGITYYYGAEH